MQLSILSDAQLKTLHEASLHVLAKTGIQVPHPRVLDLFAEAGARIDRASNMVWIPEALVAHSLEIAGKSFTIYGRNRTQKAVFGAGMRNYNSTAGQAFWVDDIFQTRRYTTLDDVRMAARMADALSQITIAGAMADPLDIPREHRCVVIAAELLKNTTKPITFWFHDRASARFILDLFTIVAGNEQAAAAYPYAYPLLEPISPLRFPFHGLDLLFETARFPLPVHIGPMAQVGATAPGTLAGTMVQENVEILASICIVQLIHPGTPVCYGGIPHVLDMRTTQMVFAGPEQALMAAAMTQMGKYYGLPVYINVGLTDSKVPDAQAGLEIGVTLAFGAMAGADIFGHLGICGVDQGASLVMLALQNEIIAYVERLMRGAAWDAETLALDVMHRVGPGGNYLAEDHTALHFRNELWAPALLDRDYWSPWIDKGRKEAADRCREQVQALREGHTPEPVPEAMARDIDALVRDAERHLKAEG